ncbi:hypothetical protein BRADI_4g23219v3 [Brachypodium distachyon]|uniref:Uncharacterized protein n=1 Tax=Brachypodium distachyon TaxID=15368 RepID=A0A2K2CPN4_BRADI|nr:hypothetical protein BRADI_4g23219v3 [Brachypodium distachyon]
MLAHLLVGERKDKLKQAHLVEGVRKGKLKQPHLELKLGLLQPLQQEAEALHEEVEVELQNQTLEEAELQAHFTGQVQDLCHFFCLVTRGKLLSHCLA